MEDSDPFTLLSSGVLAETVAQFPLGQVFGPIDSGSLNTFLSFIITQCMSYTLRKMKWVDFYPSGSSSRLAEGGGNFESKWTDFLQQNKATTENTKVDEWEKDTHQMAWWACGTLRC